MWDALLTPLMAVIDRVLPDEKAREAAKLELLRQQQAGALEEVKVQLSAILAEAQSADPWTSRARPTFLYVVYALILASLPMGVLSAFAPETAKAVAAGMQAWLAAIPTDIVELFQWVMLGYVGARSVEKVRGAAK
ncbi:3TM-type holin [Oleisolibacter albus]|uniref:3TM-type holin n=1 Tax=Oleisolibacter albus TaxID=2171757 RepID=UPI000DF1C4F4|nr:3TM-type holin [Oleisolibacter albus]